MADFRKVKLNSILGHVEKILREQTQQNDHLILGLSGGIDSVVLLNILVTLSAKMHFSLSAIYVNHGISFNADRWEIFCQDLCKFHNVPITVTRVKINQNLGASLEAAARELRYQVFEKLEADYILLAQHLDDQAETLFLQLLRGAGLRGLRAMPLVRVQAGKLKNGTLNFGPPILRPLLEVSKNEIENFAQKNKLNWITDESNGDISFDRNFLRHKIFPLLAERFPSYRTNFFRASRHVAEASSLLDELARIDEQSCTHFGKLQIEGLRTLELSRAANLLRFTFSRQGMVLPSTAKLRDILQQLLSSGQSTRLNIIFGNTQVRCFRGSVYINLVSPLPKSNWQFSWRGEERVMIQELGGEISLVPQQGAGISLQKLKENQILIRSRSGGEYFQPDCKRPRRSLKNLLREASLPPWEREMLPILLSGKNLVWVPGIGVDCNFQATPGEPGLVVKWLINSS
ncbi:MAG: tRNA lysidine(34) synthetase TilS [Nitrosomonadaceae bacterium]|nr:tRNA lysidine(34) synthetase TilS [Nitrosospira sp.]MDW7652808.1 tRNA lysidine(34) synthetase TilS [Nitrosomonadaceae bacterium]